MSNDFFENKANTYEQDFNRVSNVERIASGILKDIKFNSKMNILDFGSGTGLLLEQIAPEVNSITAVDISKSMNEQLAKKKTNLECELEIIEMDLTTSDLDSTFDGIISSMTMHHVKDIQAMFNKFHSMLNPQGFIAIADLETEDGSFHQEDTGVFHFGFSESDLAEFASKAGFKHINISHVSTVQKPYGGYPVLLLTATV